MTLGKEIKRKDTFEIYSFGKEVVAVILYKVIGNTKP